MIPAIDITYSDGDTTMIGQMVVAPGGTAPRPGLLLAPFFGGRGAVEDDRAQALAEAGYAVMIVDYYGDGRRSTDHDQAREWMAELMADRPVLTRRMQAALSTLAAQDGVDAGRLGALGFCLGGKAVLDLARSGADFGAAISIHGVYDTPDTSRTAVKAPILLLHGWDDPLAQPHDAVALGQELTERGADWQMLAFGHTGHSFTNPKAQNHAEGVGYSELASNRSWRMMDGFLKEQLGSDGLS